MRPVSVSIFFPAYNEEENIERITLEAMRIAEASPYIRDYEVIIVDDGSRDRTPEIAEELARRFDQVRVVHHRPNRGYGAALITGLASATKEYVFFTDADCQFDLREIGSLLAHVPEYEVVIGYRAPRRDPFMRKINAWGWNKLNRFFFGLKVRDIDCAFKLFRRDLVQQLTITSQGAMASAETLIRLTTSGVPIKEVPVSHLPRQAGNPTGAKLSVITRALGEMFRLYQSDLGSVSHKEFARYVVVGIFNTALDAALYVLLTRFTPFFLDGSTLAKFLSFFAGTISSFVLNRTWTFGIRTRPEPAEVVRFYAAVSLALAVNVAAFYFFANMLGFYDLIALVLSTFASFAVNYTLARLWVFRARRVARAPAY